jgi:hypothetical protein
VPEREAHSGFEVKPSPRVAAVSNVVTMTDDKNHPDAERVPSGGSTDRALGDDSSDTASGGAPDDNTPDENTVEADGTPVENPSGG